MIAGIEELKVFSKKSKDFINSLNLSPEQYEKYIEMIKSLLYYIRAVDHYGIEAYNTNVEVINDARQELRTWLEMIDKK